MRDILEVYLIKGGVCKFQFFAHIDAGPRLMELGCAFLLLLSFISPPSIQKKKETKIYKTRDNGYDVPMMCLQCICIM